LKMGNGPFWSGRIHWD